MTGRIGEKRCQSVHQKFDVAEIAFVLIANRLCEPSSEHGLGRWLEHTFVCDSLGPVTYPLEHEPQLSWIRHKFLIITVSYEFDVAKRINSQCIKVINRDPEYLKRF